MTLLSKFYQDERWKRYSLVTAKKLSKAFTQGQIQLKPTVVEKNLLPFQLIRLNTIQFRKGHFETLLNAYGEYYLSTLPLKRDSRVLSFILCLTSELPFCYSSPGDSPCFDRWRTTITTSQYFREMETPCFIAEAAKLVLMRSESRVPKEKETSPSTLNFDEVKSGEIFAQPHNSFCLQYWMREGSGVTIARRLPLWLRLLCRIVWGYTEFLPKKLQKRCPMHSIDISLW